MSRILAAESRRNWLVVLCVLGLPILVRAEDERELLALVQARHRSAQESIHSISCTVRVETGFPTLKQTGEGKYWRSFDRIRIQEEQAGARMDYYYMTPAGEVRAVGRYRTDTGQTGWTTSRELINEAPQVHNVWYFMLLGFDRHLPHAINSPRVKRERIDGRDCVRVTMDLKGDLITKGPNSQHTFWFDVGRNYLVWKTVEICKDNRIELEILEFIEPQPGVFFPTKRAGKSFRGGEQTSHSFMTLSDVRINEPIAKGIFELPPIPAGTMCSDFIKKQRYPIDATWQQIPGSKAKPFDRYAIPATSPGQGGFTTQSTAEPRSWTAWIVPGSLAVLVLAGVVWLYRRYRSFRQHLKFNPLKH